MNPIVCISVHDVSPSTWRSVMPLIALLGRVGAPPTTLLVVPQFHGHRAARDDSTLVREVDALVRDGHEVALHGYYHLDDSPPPRSVDEYVQRRMLTDREGEFASLAQAEAAQRIRRGREMLEALRWPVSGFVPPAWLASPGTRAALGHSGLRYTSDRSGLTWLEDGRTIRAPVITASARSAWRRLAWRACIALALGATKEFRVVRVALHPADTRHASLMACWQSLLRELLAAREPLTKQAVMALRQ